MKPELAISELEQLRGIFWKELLALFRGFDDTELFLAIQDSLLICFKSYILQLMSKSQPDIMLSLLAVGSFIGPVLLAVVVIVLGFLQPSCNHITQLMSELGEVGVPNGVIMNRATAILGISILLFAFGLLHGLTKGTALKIGFILTAVAGTCMIGGGIFPCDPGCVPVTFQGTIHHTVSMIGFPAIIFAPFALSQQFKSSRLWQNYRMYSILTGVFTAILVPLYLSELLKDWNGGIQRVMLGTLLVWMEVISIKLFRISTGRTPKA